MAYAQSDEEESGSECVVNPISVQEGGSGSASTSAVDSSSTSDEDSSSCSRNGAVSHSSEVQCNAEDQNAAERVPGR